MLITVSGPQGTGKSTVLKTLEQNYNFNVIPNKTSRNILSDWNLKLTEVNSSIHLTYKFQQEILKRHRESDIPYLDSDKIWIKERSYLDVFIYALNILGPHNQYSEFINEYFQQCKDYQSSYDCVIYLTGRKDYIPEDDGVRSINKYFVQMIDNSMQYFSTQFNANNMLCIDSSNHERRIEQIINHINCI